jgi:hypothetical protein
VPAPTGAFAHAAAVRIILIAEIVPRPRFAA